MPRKRGTRPAHCCFGIKYRRLDQAQPASARPSKQSLEGRLGAAVQRPQTFQVCSTELADAFRSWGLEKVEEMEVSSIGRLC